MAHIYNYIHIHIYICIMYACMYLHVVMQELFPRQYGLIPSMAPISEGSLEGGGGGGWFACTGSFQKLGSSMAYLATVVVSGLILYHHLVRKVYCFPRVHGKKPAFPGAWMDGIAAW